MTWVSTPPGARTGHTAGVLSGESGPAHGGWGTREAHAKASHALWQVYCGHEQARLQPQVSSDRWVPAGAETGEPMPPCGGSGTQQACKQAHLHQHMAVQGHHRRSNRCTRTARWQFQDTAGVPIHIHRPWNSGDLVSLRGTTLPTPPHFSTGTQLAV